MFPTTVSVARSTGNLSRRYRRMDAMPRTGSASRSHGEAAREPAREVHGEREYDGGARSHGADDGGERDVPRATWPKSKPCQGSCRRGLVADGLLPACVAALFHAQLASSPPFPCLHHGTDTSAATSDAGLAVTARKPNGSLGSARFGPPHDRPCGTCRDGGREGVEHSRLRQMHVARIRRARDRLDQPGNRHGRPRNERRQRGSPGNEHGHDRDQCQGRQQRAARLRSTTPASTENDTARLSIST